VFSMLAEEFAGTQEGSIHFHHLLPENGGCVRIASTIEEHVRQLSDRLRDPEGAHAETQRFIAGFIRPYGTDRPASPIFVDTIERLAAAPAPRPRPAPAWTYALRPVVLAAALAGAIGGWLKRPEPVKRLRKRLQKLAYRTRKRMARVATITLDRAGKLWRKSVVKPLRTRWWTS
jgi:hypothetical protein